MPRQTGTPKRILKKTAEAATAFLSSADRQLFFFDEGRFGLRSDRGRRWAQKGLRPYARVSIGYRNFYIYASVCPHTGDSFSLFLPWANTDIMSLYLEQLSLTYPDKEIMLIMDQAGWHDSNDLQVPHNIHIELLPSYSPELNPVEKLWQWLRRHVCRNRLFASDKELEDALATALNRRSPEDLATLCHCSYLSYDN